MRMIGLAERSLEKRCARGSRAHRVRQAAVRAGVTRERIAESRMEIEQARLLT
jgi:acyl-CoA dehydrogenase